MAELIDITEAPVDPLVALAQKQKEEDEEMTPEERERHERFLKAREEGMRKARQDMRGSAGQYHDHTRFKIAVPRFDGPPRRVPGRVQQSMQNSSTWQFGGQAKKTRFQPPRLGGRISAPTSIRGLDELGHSSASSRSKGFVLCTASDEAEEQEVKQERDRVWARIKELIADASELTLSEDLKEELVPLMKLSIVVLLFLDVYHEALATQQDFRKLISRDRTKRLLRRLRQWVDKSGIVAATELHDACRRHLEEVKRRQRFGEDVSPEELSVESWLDKKMSEEDFQQEGMIKVIKKCEGFKQLGMVAYEGDNLGGAMANWKRADEWLRHFKQNYEYSYYNDQMQDLHAAILKNRALGCLRIDRWPDALDCASCAIEINDHDHKAWFRKACAFEGLGRPNEAFECLLKVQHIADGRPDREKLLKEVFIKKESLRALTWVEQPADDSMSKSTPALPAAPLGRIPSPAKSHMKPEVAERTIHTFDYGSRRRISIEDARHLLQDLRSAYGDAAFQRQVLELSREVRRDKVKFLSRLKQVAFPIQRPVLEMWEFEPTQRGVQEMTLALGDHTRGAHADPALIEEAADTARALYGAMFDIVFATAAPPARPPPLQLKQRGGADEDESDDDLPPALIEG